METVLCRDCGEPIPPDQPARPVRWTIKVRRRLQAVHGFVHAGCRQSGTFTGASGYVSLWAPIGGTDVLPPAACEYCHRLVVLANDKRRRRTVCSPRCAVAVTKSHRKGERQPACSVCGGSLAGRADTAYCSPACRQRAYRLRQKTTRDA